MYRPGKFSNIYTTLRICKWRELCQCHFNVLTLILACNVCISPIHLPQMDGSLLLYHESIKAHLYHLTRNLHLLNEHSTWKMSHLISLRLSDCLYSLHLASESLYTQCWEFLFELLTCLISFLAFPLLGVGFGLVWLSAEKA